MFSARKQGIDGQECMCRKGGSRRDALVRFFRTQASKQKIFKLRKRSTLQELSSR